MITKKNKIFALIVVLIPILNIYATPITGFGVGDLVLLITACVILFKMLKTGFCFDEKCKLLFAFFCYSLLVSIVNGIFSNYSSRDIAIRLLVELFYITMILIFISSNIISIEDIYKYYRIFAIIVTSIIVIQTFSHYVFSKDLFFLIPYLNYNQSSLASYDNYINSYSYMYSYYFRPTSLFLEPSHAALYLCPFLLINLFKKNNGIFQFIISLYCSVGILLTTSGTGILFVIVMWIIFLMKFILNMKFNFANIICLFFSILLIFIVVNLPVFDIISNNILTRVEDIGSGSSSSINERLIKGFQLYNSLDFCNKIIGIGCGSLDSFIVLNNLQNTSFGTEYINSISYIMVSTGFFGLILYCYILLIFRKKSKCIFKNELLIGLLILYLTGSILFSTFDFIFYVVLFSYGTIKEKNEKIILTNQNEKFYDNYYLNF